MEQYIFFRENGFYPIFLNNDNEAIACVEKNPGTLKIERVNVGGENKVLWESPDNTPIG